MRTQFLLLVTAFAFSTFALGQTSTFCNPLLRSCPSDATLGKIVAIDFTNGESEYFTAEARTTMTYGNDGDDGDDGAEFILASKTPGSDNHFHKIHIFWNGLEAMLPSLKLITSEGNTTAYNRATYPTIDNPQDIGHRYTIDWTSEYIKWYIDDSIVRTLAYDDALDGKNFPQTPMMIKIGVWDGGRANESEGTVSWANGYTDLSEAPFIMFVKNLTIEDYTTSGEEYTYGDMTGDYKSIIISDNATSASNTTSVLYSTNSTVSTSSSDNATTTATTLSSLSSASSSSSSTAAASAANLARNNGSFVALILALGVIYLSL